jgi:Subtilisin inhibitor-like
VNVLAAILVASTSLHITVWPNGHGHAPKRMYTLTCAPVAGTLPHRVSACAKLARLRSPFAPTPPGTACTEIYGGPQQALVTGRFRGRLVHADFGRKDGCEISRWLRVQFLFPGTVSSAQRRWLDGQ